MKIVKSSYEIVSLINGYEMLRRIELAGRTCYKSEDKITDDSSQKFVAMVLKRGHETVIEHESASVRIICDRGISHEIVRHRLASYSQESTRYCNYTKNKFGREITVIDPRPHVDEVTFEAWRAGVLFAESIYFQMLDAGASPQMARSVLPNSLKTEIVMTANLREWRHFFKMRTPDTAHPQLREITRPMLAEFRSRIPVVFDDVGELTNA
jgi:thymidylate synthase (FAD)